VSIKRAVSSLKVMVLDHLGKSRTIAAALAQRGCQLVSDPCLADVVLIDHDVPTHGKLPYAEACVAAGGRAFIYPHGAGSGLMAMWDGLFPISPIIDGVLVYGPGHIEVARRYGYPHPVHEIGWTLCELRPRRATGRVENVVFAALHPKGDGHLSDWKVERNRDTFRRLLATPATLTVRFIGTLEQNGLWIEPGVDYVQAEYDDFAGQIAQIDAADAVVSDRSTFSNLAIARGVTTVMYDSDVIAKDLDRSHSTDNIELYRDYIRFPFDADDGDLWDLMRAAAEDEELVGAFRELFVGGPFDVDGLIAVLRGDGAHITPACRAARLHAAALASVERGHANGAAELLTEAIEGCLDLKLLNDLAVVRWHQGRREDAEILLLACLALDPTRTDAQENLAAIASASAA
jgi:hypothetical protein